jgi:hypothetical protein
MDFPYPLFPLAVTIARDRHRHDFSLFLLRLFLWRLREGGNTRGAGSAHRLAHDIPADGEFSAVRR